MAIKHVVTGGLGFTVPSFLLTDGLGLLTIDPGASIARMTVADTGGGVRLTVVNAITKTLTAVDASALRLTPIED